jgi:hypothetical protein
MEGACHQAKQEENNNNENSSRYIERKAYSYIGMNVGEGKYEQK